MRAWAAFTFAFTHATAFVFVGPRVTIAEAGSGWGIAWGWFCPERRAGRGSARILPAQFRGLTIYICRTQRHFVIRMSLLTDPTPALITQGLSLALFSSSCNHRVFSKGSSRDEGGRGRARRAEIVYGGRGNSRGPGINFLGNRNIRPWINGRVIMMIRANAGCM